MKKITAFVAILTLMLVCLCACGKAEDSTQPEESSDAVVVDLNISEESPTPTPTVEPTVEPTYEKTAVNEEFGTPDFDSAYYEIHDIDEKTQLQGYITDEALALIDLLWEQYPDSKNISVAYQHREEPADVLWYGFETEEYADIDHVYMVGGTGSLRYYILRDNHFIEVPAHN